MLPSWLPCLLVFFLSSVLTHKILVWSPTISRSHMISNGRIADELAAAGHDVVLFEPDFLRIFDKVNSSKIARRWPVHGFSLALHEVIQGFSGDAFADSGAIEMNKGWLAYLRAYDEHCKDLINRDDLMAELRAEKFDAFFGEQLNLCGNGLAHALGIRAHFWISSCPIGEPMAWYIGMPLPMSYVPSLNGFEMDLEPTYWQRANNLFYAAVGLYYAQLANDELTDIFREKYGASFPAVESIAADSDVIFVATDEFIEYPRPSMPNVVHIGGLGLKDSDQKLDQTFSSEMSKGSSGVVYFSLGTIVNTTTLPPFAMRSVIGLAKAFPDHHFIVRADKYDKWARELASGLSNVFVTDWTPQPAILSHPRLRTFITHAGYNGVMESARAGVPLIAMPFLFDQTKNAGAIARTGWGLYLRRQVMRDAPGKMEEALRTILSDNKYKAAAMRLRQLVRTKPFNASERLIRHTEFVLQNGGIKELLVDGRHLSLIVHNNLDIFIPATLLLLFVLYASSRLLYYIISAVTGSSRKTKAKLQ